MNASQRRIRKRVLDRRNEPHLDREVEEEADEIFVFHERHTGENPITGRPEYAEFHQSMGEMRSREDQEFLESVSKQSLDNQALAHAADSRMAGLRDVLNKEEPNV